MHSPLSGCEKASKASLKRKEIGIKSQKLCNQIKGSEKYGNKLKIKLSGC